MWKSVLYIFYLPITTSAFTFKEHRHKINKILLDFQAFLNETSKNDRTLTTTPFVFLFFLDLHCWYVQRTDKLPCSSNKRVTFFTGKLQASVSFVIKFEEFYHKLFSHICATGTLCTAVCLICSISFKLSFVFSL